jgi:hypothetical protein
MTVSLRYVSEYPDDIAFPLLYELLKERDDTINIDHSELPSYEDHVAHCRKCLIMGRRRWFVLSGEEIIGLVEYLVDLNTVGVFIFKKYQGSGRQNS